MQPFSLTASLGFASYALCSMQSVDRFRANEHSILVATDAAARGLDIPGVRTVVHYQLPLSAEVDFRFAFVPHFAYLLSTCNLSRYMFIDVGEQLEPLLTVAALRLSLQMMRQNLQLCANHLPR